ncbi:MAG: hypothetical protein JSV65_07765 [Armatimonadota bacterium]|nr:MAG: hypothetical protein JSV65_07765 [Armatimonadota bacterium]
MTRSKALLAAAWIGLAILCLAAAGAPVIAQAYPPAGDEAGSQVTQPLDFPLSEVIAAARVYYLVTLVLWLSATAFVAGLLIGMAAEKRAGTWATLAVAVFLCILWGAGGAILSQVMYVPTLLVGALLVLGAAAAGGMIGQYVWQGMIRRQAPSRPDAPPSA